MMRNRLLGLAWLFLAAIGVLIPTAAPGQGIVYRVVVSSCATVNLAGPPQKTSAPFYEDVNGVACEKLSLAGGSTDQLTYSATGSPDNAVISSTLVKPLAAPANLFYYSFSNYNTVVVHVIFYDASAATVGTTPPKFVVDLPPGSATVPSIRDSQVGGVEFANDLGLLASTSLASAAAPSVGISATLTYKAGN
jgi:hypothetical protein